MEYQIYAIDKDGQMNHCGPENIDGLVTIDKCKKLESSWRKWRRNYLTDNPGDYPLRKHHKRTARYILNEIGKKENFVINFV